MRWFFQARPLSGRNVLARNDVAAHLLMSIKRRADALANLPAWARWFPERGCGRIGNETGRKRQPSSVQPMEGFSMRELIWKGWQKSANALLAWSAIVCGDLDLLSGQAP